MGRESDGVIGIIERIHSDLRSWNETLTPELKLVGVVARGRSVLLLHFLYNEVILIIIIRQQYQQIANVCYFIKAAHLDDETLSFIGSKATHGSFFPVLW